MLSVCCPKLTKCYVFHHGIHSHHIDHFDYELVKQCKTFRIRNQNKTYITEEILEFFTKHRDFQNLEFFETELTDEILTTVAKHNPRLSSMKIKYCGNIFSATSLQLLFQMCTKLQCLHLYDVCQLSANDFIELFNTTNCIKHVIFYKCVNLTTYSVIEILETSAVATYNTQDIGTKCVTLSGTHISANINYTSSIHIDHNIITENNAVLNKSKTSMCLASINCTMCANVDLQLVIDYLLHHGERITCTLDLKPAQ